MSKFCAGCGNQMSDEARFCGNCGAAVAQATPPQEALHTEQRPPTQQDAPPQIITNQRPPTTPPDLTASPLQTGETTYDPSAPQTSTNGALEYHQAQPEQDGAPFHEADRRYAELRWRHEAREIDNEQFGGQIQQLAVQDGEGRWWSKHRDTGAWHCHNGSAWVPGTPPNYRTTIPEPRQGNWRKQAATVGAGAALLAGVAWLLNFFEYAPSIDLRDWMPYLALVSSLGGLAGLYIRQAPGCGKLGLIGLIAASVGTFLLFVPDVNSFLGLRGLYNLVIEVSGFLLLACGLVLLGVATLGARVLPVWSGPLLIVGAGWLLILFFYYLAYPVSQDNTTYLIIGLAVDYALIVGRLKIMSGSIVLSPLWLALAYALWSRRGAFDGEEASGR